jgi:hypothetical protein
MKEIFKIINPRAIPAKIIKIKTLKPIAPWVIYLGLNGYLTHVAFGFLSNTGMF